MQWLPSHIRRRSLWSCQTQRRPWRWHNPCVAVPAWETLVVVEDDPHRRPPQRERMASCLPSSQPSTARRDTRCPQSSLPPAGSEARRLESKTAPTHPYAECADVCRRMRLDPPPIELDDLSLLLDARRSQQTRLVSPPARLFEVPWS